MPGRIGFAVLAHAAVAVVALFVSAGQASAISNVIPEPTSRGLYPVLAISRQAGGNGLAAEETTLKLVYVNRPDSVFIFDGPYCGSSNYDAWKQSANSPCSSTNLDGEVYFDFQALDNDTGVAGPVMRVLGSTMAANNGVNRAYSVNLSSLAVAPSTDGRYFVKLRVSYARPNPPSCGILSPISSTCRTGSNSFRVATPRTTDYVTYGVTSSDPAPLGIISVPGTTGYDDYTFQFGTVCDLTGSALQRELRWRDADYGNIDQPTTISWDLIDDSAPGGPQVVVTRRDGQLGGQGEERTYQFNFVAGHKYRWRWNHVHGSNGLQIWLPFDNYDYARTCDSDGNGSPTPVPTPPPPPPPLPAPTPPPPPPVGDANVFRPYFQVAGGDLSAGQGMSLGGSNCAIPANTRAGFVGWNRRAAGSYGGAGTQYAAYVLNHLQDFATAQGDADRPTGLSFANDNDAAVDRNAGLFGGSFAGGACALDYFANATDTLDGDWLVNSLPGFPAGGDIANGSSLSYYIDGDLYINSNIRFSGAYPALDQIPYVSFTVRGDIFIDKTVTQLDGIFIAQPRDTSSDSGSIYTCAADNTPPFTALNLDRQLHLECNTGLAVNGSLSAHRLWLLRTAGDVNGAPAETINYMPELWLAPKPSGNRGVSARSVGPAPAPAPAPPPPSRSDSYDAITNLPPLL